jgi:hypothetical protein
MARKQKRAAAKRDLVRKTKATKKPKAAKSKKTKAAGGKKKKAAVSKKGKLGAALPPLTHVAKYGWYGPAW